MTLLKKIGAVMDKADLRNINAMIRAKQEELDDLLWQRQQITHKVQRAKSRRGETDGD